MGGGTRRQTKSTQESRFPRADCACPASHLVRLSGESAGGERLSFKMSQGAGQVDDDPGVDGLKAYEKARGWLFSGNGPGARSGSELGVDIGSVKSVAQIGAPRALASLR